mmetsp:Transcript_76975/g.213953  ORF Transcript_76975/g.213953 Transcript_76975/m.213953 type:complete len:502 (-) Transcript_76975:233-1738(-)
MQVEGREAAARSVGTPVPALCAFRFQEIVAEAKDQLRLAAPVIVGLLSNRFIGTISMVFVGHQGDAALAAVGLATSLASVTGYSLLVGVAGTLQTTAGQAFGAHDWTEVSLSLQRCALLMSVMVFCVAILWLTSKEWLCLLGQDPEVAAMAQVYLLITLPGVFCYMVTQCLQNWLAAQRITKPTGIGGIINAACFAPLCWFLVYPCKFGFYGAAIATCWGNVFMMIWMVCKTRSILRTQLQNSWQGWSRRALTQWRPFIRLALPNFLMISEWWASEITILMAGALPNADLSLAAVALFGNVNSIFFVPPLSLGIAANTRVSNELGAGQTAKAKGAALAAICTGLCIAALSFSVVLIFRRPWVMLFTGSDRIMKFASPVVMFSAWYVFFDGLCGIAAGALKGCGRHPVLAPVIIASYYFVGLPLSYLLAWHGNLGTLGLVLGSCIATTVHCLAFLTLLATTRWPLMAERAQARVQAKPLIREEEPAGDGDGEAPERGSEVPQ